MVNTGQTIVGFNLREEPANLYNYTVMRVNRAIGHLAIDYTPPSVPTLSNAGLICLLVLLGWCVARPGKGVTPLI